jgi:hypothetical protein
MSDPSRSRGGRGSDRGSASRVGRPHESDSRILVPSER